jgi:hypothetical protein
VTQPANGVRLELTLVANEDGAARYAGSASLPGSTMAVSVEASAARATVTLDDSEGEPLTTGMRATLEKLITALIRAATRVELAKGEPIPSKIVRWRPIDGG